MVAIRASRLTAIALLIEARGLVTATQLAAEFGVSVRTIYRDIDELAAAGVPVYAERGAAGGYRLTDGYRMRPPGLSPTEARALGLAGIPDAAAALGLERELTSAQMKLMAVLGPDQRLQARRLRQRLYVDGPGWFGAKDEPRHLAAITEAVWEGAVVRVRYRSWAAESIRILEPRGLVLKGGTWYLVARDRDADQTRTYRVGAIRECEPVGEVAAWPEDFDLAAYWRHASQEFVNRVYSMEVELLVAPAGMPDLAHMGSALYVAGMREAGPPDRMGWRHVAIPFENVREAAMDLLRLGARAEVLSPQSVRDEVARTAAEITAMLKHGRLSAGTVGPSAPEAP